MKSKSSELEKPVCPSCGRKTVYFRTDGSVRCTACGYDSKKVEK